MSQPPFRMTVCGIEELGGHCGAGVSHVLSILDPDRAMPEAFGSYGEHARLELRFHDIIEDTPGLLAPTPADVDRILAFGRTLSGAEAHLLVHCHAGISRSSASMTLILAQAMPEEDSDAVLADILAVREKAWPNLRMIEIGDAMLGRRGTLVAAAHRVYRHQLDIRPHLVEFMTNLGRAREVAAAQGSADS